MEISVSAVQNSLADIYASEPQLSVESAWNRPRHILEQSETMARVTPTDINRAETEIRPQLPTLGQGHEKPEISVTEEEIDVVGLETDPETVHNIIKGYVENLDKQSEPKPQASPHQAYTTGETSVIDSDSTHSKSEHIPLGTMASEFKPYDFVDTLVDEINLMYKGGDKLPSI